MQRSEMQRSEMQRSEMGSGIRSGIRSELRRSGKKIFWGMLFLLGAVALVVGKLGLLQDIGFWSIVLTIGLLGVIVDGICSRSFGKIAFSLAFLAMVYDEKLGIEALTPWTVLGAAALVTIGLRLLFPRKRDWVKHLSVGKDHSTEASVVSSEEGDTVHVEACFCQAVKYVTGKELQSIHAECSFGNLEIYLDDAVLKDHQAVLKVDCSFGNMVLHVPASWKVVLNVATSFGGCQEEGRCNPQGEDCLLVKGDVDFGHLTIRYF